MTTCNIYLNFPGNTEEAFEFYRSVLGGEFVGGITRFGDMPDAEDLPEEERHKVMHVALPVGEHNTLMGTDALESMNQSVTPGNQIFVSLHPDSKEEADRLFKGLSEGGEVAMPMEDMFWGGYFGQFTDKFGVPWMIHYQGEQD